jgi:hypothetical protein
MNISELINEIISEWAYRVDDGMPDAKNPIHLKELSIVLKEMGLSHIKDTLIENLLTEKGKTPEEIEEADKSFTNPILNKKVSYKNDKGENKEGIVGNLLRQPEGSPARTAAEKMLPPEGSPERETLNQELGGEGQSKKPEDGGDKKGAEAGGAPKEDPIKAAAPMFDPKADPAMGARMDREKAANDKLAQNDKEASDKEADLNKKDKTKDEFAPIEVQDVAKEMPQADTDTFSGGSDIPDAIDPKELEQFNTDIKKVAQQVADAKANGEPAPNINLCDVTVPGTNLYCDDNLGIPRDEMPQFKGNASPGSRAAGMEADASGEVDTEPVFREMLQQKGIKTLQTEVPADKLKATQKDLVGAKVVGMMGALEKDPNHPKITAPIYVSRDGYVIDGHHRWAAVVAYNAQNPDKQIQMKTTVLDQDIKDAIPMANKFAEDMGIAAKKADANKESPIKPTSAPDNKVNAIAQKALDKIKDGIKDWSVDEKEFFNKKVHKGNSPQRRSFGEAFKHKMKGAWEAIKHGAEHEVHTFKEAGSGIKAWFGGEDVSDSQKKAMISVAKKVAFAAAIGIAGGGLAHGAIAFTKHLMLEFVPHIVFETIAVGAGKAALFAGPMDIDIDTDKQMMKFMEIIADKVQNEEIPNEVMADAIESYNEKKQPEMTKENLDLADELMLEMIYGLIDEATPNAKTQRILNQRIKYKEDGVEHNVKVATAIKYKNSDKLGQKKAYKDALQLLKKAGVAIPDAGATKKPVGKTIAPSGFRKTSDMEKKPTKVVEPKAEPTPRSETNNPHKKNGNEGETILELKPEEIDSILEKYVNAGEATPDDMRELAPEYANQDMADGYADEDYYSKDRKHSTEVRKQPYKVNDDTRTQLQNAGFPEKYIKFLERCINTQVKGKKPPVTELIKQGGAGQIQSQFGEVMAMAFMSIRDPQQRRQLADIMNAEIQKSGEEFGGGKQSPIATKDWVEASLTHAEAFDSAMDEKYGKGQWRFEGAAWDIKGDIEALGLDYKNKGFSTDVMLRVQPLKNGKPNGPARAQKNSLKKDENIFFFNGSINEVNNFVLNFLDEKERKRVRGYEAIVTKAGASNKNPEDRAAALAAAERITGLKGTKAVAALKQMAADIRTKAFDSAPPHVQQAVSKVRNFGAAQTASAEKLIKTANTNIRNANNVIDNAKNIDGGDKDFAKFSYKAVKDCKASGTKDITTCIRQKLSAAGEDTTDDRVCKVAVLASKVAIAAGDTNAEKALSKHYNLAVEAGNALMEVLPESPELMGGLMQKLADAFPMKTCMQGEEFMCIDGMKVTQKTLQTVFGVASYDELQKGMKLKRLPNGETILVYGAKDKNGQDIPIGVVGARQKGKGYEGTVGFEISCSDDFALAVAEANSKNGDESTSNEKARQSIGKRVATRNAKANKKK